MTARKLQKCEAYVQTAARGVLSVSLVAILLSSTALAQEMGGQWDPEVNGVTSRVRITM